MNCLRADGEDIPMVDVSKQVNTSEALRLLLMIAGIAAAGTGIFGIAFGSFWAATGLEIFDGVNALLNLTTILPFIPISLIAVGVFLMVKSRL